MFRTKNMKIVKTNQLKIVIFTAVKNHRIRNLNLKFQTFAAEQANMSKETKSTTKRKILELYLSLIMRKPAFYHLSRVMRKPTICICENKDADQLRGNREADQRLFLRYIDSTILLLSKSEISSL